MALKSFTRIHLSNGSPMYGVFGGSNTEESGRVANERLGMCHGALCCTHVAPTDPQRLVGFSRRSGKINLIKNTAYVFLIVEHLRPR